MPTSTSTSTPTDLTQPVPVVLFVYKRPQQTKATLEALASNHLASSTDLIVFSDAARSETDTATVEEVRSLFQDLKGFRSVRLICRETNQGLANSIIQGVTEIIEVHGKVIVLEDDLITSRNFLDFMNQALDSHQDKKSVFAVSGYAYPLLSTRTSKFDAAYSHRASSWGWATWQDRWSLVDWSMSDHSEYLKDPKRIAEFEKGGGDLPDMLARQMQGLVNSWMIRWVYCQRKLGLVDVFPTVSKISNIGFGSEATHTQCGDLRYRTPLDPGERQSFCFAEEPSVPYPVYLELRWKFSTLRRILYKLVDLYQLPEQRQQFRQQIRFWLKRRIGR